MEQFEATTKKWGNSLGITIPSEIIKEEKIKPNEKVNVLIFKNYGKEKAEHYFNHWLDLCIKVPHTSIKLGMKIKLENKKERLSYIDCIGYAFCLQNDVIFLTGDSKFENRIGVDFVR